MYINNKKIDWYKILMIVAGVCAVVLAIKLVGIPLFNTIRSAITAPVVDGAVRFLIG